MAGGFAVSEHTRLFLDMKHSVSQVVKVARAGGVYHWEVQAIEL